MFKPKVSIIVPVYNGENYIDKCIGNLQAQTYENLEFILVDDGSSDTTPAKCDEIAVRDDRFIVIHQKNSGPSISRNNGMQRAGGDYILFYDVDDDISKDLVEENVKVALENDADVVMFCFEYFNLDNGRRWNNAHKSSFAGNDKEFFKYQLVNAIDSEVYNAPWNKLIKTSFIRENDLHFIPEYTIYEDALFVSMMLQHARKIALNSKMYYTYYVRSSGSLITKYVDSYFDSVTRFYTEALKYCSGYEDNAEQISRFSKMYVSLVTTNLKRISSHPELSFSEKERLIGRICDDSNFRDALKKAKLEPRKFAIKNLVMARNTKGIIWMYRFLSKIK